MEAIIAQGAEALIIKNEDEIIKRRIAKGYRIKELDEKLRKQRTRKEAKLLEKAQKLIHVPKIIRTNEKNKEIILEEIKGLKLSEHFDKLENAEEICIQIGESIAKLHDSGIVHGDLTTSNIIYIENSQDNKKINNKKAIEDIQSRGKVYFIDFGLGFESSHSEDKAVDLHVLKEALEARHFENSDRFWKKVIEGYKASKHFNEVIKRLEKVEKRGRYKGSY